MRVQPNPRIWPIVIAVAFWFALILLMTSMAHAQTAGVVFSDRGSARSHGFYVVGWNTTGTQIDDGTIVQADTSGLGTVPQVALGKGFKTWTGSTADFGAVIGVLMGNVPGYAQGRILIEGFHPAVKVMSGITAGSFLRPSLTATGRLAAWAVADSQSYVRPVVGRFQRYARTDSSIAYCWLRFTNR